MAGRGAWQDDGVNTTNEISAYAEAVMRSERLCLRPMQESDLPQLEQWWHTPAMLPLQTGMVIPRPEGSRLEEFRKWHSNENVTSLGFAIERLEDSQLLGSVALFGMSIGRLTATFAIQMRPDLTGQGYGTEATRLMVDYAFSTLPLHRIELGVFGYNDRARKAYAKAGFREEGQRRETIFLGGQWHDEIIMAILRQDWEATRD